MHPATAPDAAQLLLLRAHMHRASHQHRRRVVRCRSLSQLLPDLSLSPEQSSDRCDRWQCQQQQQQQPAAAPHSYRLTPAAVERPGITNIDRRCENRIAVGEHQQREKIPECMPHYPVSAWECVVHGKNWKEKRRACVCVWRVSARQMTHEGGWDQAREGDIAVIGYATAAAAAALIIEGLLSLLVAGIERTGSWNN